MNLDSYKFPIIPIGTIVQIKSKRWRLLYSQHKTTFRCIATEQTTKFVMELMQDEIRLGFIPYDVKYIYPIKA
jgi:hypothetical protein